MLLVLPSLFCLCLSLWQRASLFLANIAAWHSVSLAQRVCVPECECVSAVCQSTSLKHQLGTRTHNQNKLAALSMSPWAAARVQKCARLCLCVCKCMCVSQRMCVRCWSETLLIKSHWTEWWNKHSPSSDECLRCFARLNFALHWGPPCKD